MLWLIIDFSTALRKAMRPLEEPAPIVTFSAALRNATWLGAPPPMCACLTSERSIAAHLCCEECGRRGVLQVDASPR
eukprot:scaffold11062_cov24-Phaeocystis_antarctica.AAC.1